MWLRLEPEGNCDGDVCGDWLAVLPRGFVAILLESFHGGFVKGGRAGENFHGFDVAGLVDDGVDRDVAGDELAQGVGRSHGTDGFDELRRNDAGGVVRKRSGGV